jgi:hypothetical protein
VEIRIGRRWLAAGGYTALVLGVLLGSLLVAGLIGVAVTPYDAAGNPVLLRPELVATERYRDRVAGWDAQLREVHADLYALLVSDARDLYRDSEAANDAASRARTLAEAIEVAPAPPPAMAGLWELAREAAGLHLEAATRAALWVGSPTDESKDEAIAALEAAGAVLDELEANPWLVGNDSLTQPEAPRQTMGETGQWDSN